MSDDPNAPDRKVADRIRILEFQVDQLRRELERLEKRHAEAIYSAAWHFGAPVRVIERAIRKRSDRARDIGVDKFEASAARGRIGVGRPRIERAQPQHVFVLLERADAGDAGIQAARREIAQPAAGVQHGLAARFDQRDLPLRVVQWRFL